jgi:hypothetical protein
MIVRIQFRTGRHLRKTPGKNRHLALACGALLIPASLMAYVLGFWRLTSDIGVTKEFAIRGLFSHWQVWIVTAVTLQVAASVLNRYGRGGEFHLPRALAFRFGAVSPPPPDPGNGDPGRRPSAPAAKAS